MKGVTLDSIRGTATLVDTATGEVVYEPGTVKQSLTTEPEKSWPAVVPLPPALSRMFTNRYGGKGRTKTDEYREWIEHAVAILRDYRRPESYPVECEYVVREKLRSNADVENRTKALTDALVKAGILTDDGIKYVRKVSIEYQPGGTGVSVTVRE